jgi:superfamily II DNA or RNA helicase
MCNMDNMDNIKYKKLKKKGYYIKKNELTKDQIESIKNELIVQPKLLDFGETNDDKSYKLYRQTNKYLIVPKYYGIKKFGDCKSKLKEDKINIEFKGELRDYQIPIVEKVLNHMDKEYGGLLAVPCGRGKTSMAIYIAVQKGVKTLVVVHKSFLLDQWVARIKQFTNARVGVIRGKVIDIENKDIVIGMIQSISMKEYESKVFNKFGMVIYDESHHCASKVFSKALMKTVCKYTLALSATPYRGDGLINVMHWFLGETIYKEKFKQNNQVVAKIYNYTSDDKNFIEKKFNYGPQKGKPDVIKMMSNLVELKERSNHIVNIINAIRKDPDRKIIVLSKRIDHLKELKNGLDILINKDVDDGKILEGEIKTYFYIGEMKRYERDEAEKFGDILFASYSLAKEGLDIDRLNTVVLTTSEKDVIQSVGRAMRKILKDGDMRPLIIDFADNLSSFKNHLRLRKQFYNQSKFIVETYELQDDKIENITYDDSVKMDKVEFECIIDDNIHLHINENDKVNISDLDNLDDIINKDKQEDKQEDKKVNKKVNKKKVDNTKEFKKRMI